MIRLSEFSKKFNAYEEVDLAEAGNRSLPIIRRITGGGAVYNDSGNFNYAFIRRDVPGTPILTSFRALTEPIVSALRELGVPVSLSGRNDILAGGRKISGNAQARRNGRVLHHGTLLFSVDTEALARVLRPSPAKYAGRGVRSAASRVANLRDLLPRSMSAEEFASALCRLLMKKDKNAVSYSLTAADERRVEQIAAARYRSWDWNIGCRPDRRFTREKRFPGGVLRIDYDIKEEKLRGIRFFGDFFGRQDLSALENGLEGVPFCRDAVCRALEREDFSACCEGITPDEVCTLLFGPAQASPEKKEGISA